MSIVQATLTPVRYGTADQLARLAFFRDLEQTQPEELDEVAYWLLGAVGDRRAVWERLRPDCQRLWHLITGDWDADDCDELTEKDCLRLPLCATEAQVEELRYEVTRDRLTSEIEQTIWLARYRASATRRAAHQAAAL